jgi:hypothetical protein
VTDGEICNRTKAAELNAEGLTLQATGKGLAGSQQYIQQLS